jgi:predicted porin
MAAAVAGAFVTPALVYAQNATVQVYGKMFMEYGYADQGDGRPKTDIVQTPGSAVGFKGQEQLGGGLSAWFQCETTADPRGLSQEGWCSRNSAVGLKGGFGNVYMGKWDTPFKRSFVGQVGVADTGLGGYAFILAGNSTGTGLIGGQGASQAATRIAFKRRESGLFTYESPNFGGFTVLAAYSAANATSVVNATTNEKPRLGSIAGTYSNGPLNIALAYEKHWNIGSGSTGTGDDDKGWTIGASYNFGGRFLVGAQYTDMKFELAGSSPKKKTFFLGGDWNFAGPHHVTGGFAWADDTSGGPGGAADSTTPPTVLVASSQAPITAGGSSGAKLYNIAYQYDLSKRTNTRVGYVYLDNDSRGLYTLGGLATANTTGDRQSAIYMSFDHRW